MASAQLRRLLPRRPRTGWIGLAWLLALAAAFAGQSVSGADPQGSSAGSGAGLGGLVYVPHDFGAPEVTQSGGARSLGQAELPSLQVLAPPRLARTFAAQPTLYWYVSGPSPAPVRLTVLDFEATTAEPLLEVELPAPRTGGVHATSLAEHGVRLETDRWYEWSVALAVNPDAPSDEPVAKTIFTVVEVDPALRAKIQGAPALAQAEALASAGYWYDLIDLIAREIAAGDDPETWRALRAALLEQEGVGLEEIAAHDRQFAGAQ